MLQFKNIRAQYLPTQSSSRDDTCLVSSYNISSLSIFCFLKVMSPRESWASTVTGGCAGLEPHTKVQSTKQNDASPQLAANYMYLNQ